MPKDSRRKKALKQLSRVCYGRVLEHFQRNGDSSDENSLEDDFDLLALRRLRDVKSKR